AQLVIAAEERHRPAVTGRSDCGTSHLINGRLSPSATRPDRLLAPVRRRGTPTDPPAVVARPLTAGHYLYIKVMAIRRRSMRPDRLKEDAAEVLRDCVATRLRMANRVVTKVYDDALRPHGLKVTQMAMLVVAEDRGLIRQSQVGAELQLDDSTL